MPTEAEKLTKDSSPEQVQKAISSCISQMANENPDWKNEQCVAACYSMAERATGHPVRTKSTTIKGG